MQAIICESGGLCYGTKRAMQGALGDLKAHKNVVIFKPIIHNENAIKCLTMAGAKHCFDITDIKIGDFVILRAHGETKETYEYLSAKRIKYSDYICPNVKRIRDEIIAHDKDGYRIIIVGKHTPFLHAEVEGYVSFVNAPLVIESEIEAENFNDFSFGKYFMVFQTTFSHDSAIKIMEIFKDKVLKNGKIFKFLDTSCFANEQNIANSIKLAEKVDAFVVIGSKNSSNTNVLYETLKRIKPCALIDSVIKIKEIVSDLCENSKLDCNSLIGICAGASTMNEDIIIANKVINDI